MDSRKLSRIMTIERASQIYRVLQNRDMEDVDLDNVTVDEAELFRFAETFEDFINKNQIILIEGEVR